MTGADRPLTVIPCPQERREELYRLRATVWVAEGADPAAFVGGAWTDPRDTQRRHWIVIHEGEVIAGASLSVHPTLHEVEEAEAYFAYHLSAWGPVAAPARVIVHPEWRGRGLAEQLLGAQDEAAREAEAILAVRQASRAMRRLLERRGWQYHGPGPFDARFPHEEFGVMSLVLAPA